MIVSFNQQDKITLLKQLGQLKGGIFVKHLHQKQISTDIGLRHAGGDEFLRQQGRAQLLEELLAEIEASRSDLERLGRPKLDMSQSF